MKNKILVIGLGRFGLALARTLVEMNEDVLAIDIDQDRVEKASEFLQYCEICDSSKPEVLEEIDAKSFSTAIVSVGALQSTFLTVANLSEIGVKKIVVRLESTEYANVMRKLGATDIIVPELAAATSLAHEVVSNNVLDYYELSKNYGVVQIRINEDFESKTLIDLDLRNKYDINIVGIIRKEKFFVPKGTDSIEPLDKVLVVGKDDKVAKFATEINSED